MGGRSEQHYMVTVTKCNGTRYRVCGYWVSGAQAMDSVRDSDPDAGNMIARESLDCDA